MSIPQQLGAVAFLYIQLVGTVVMMSQVAWQVFATFIPVIALSLVSGNTISSRQFLHTIYVLQLSRNQLNQKLRQMVEAPGYVIYSNTPPHTRALWAIGGDDTSPLHI